jgi:hypothetical protein
LPARPSGQSAEAVRRVRDFLLKVGGKLVSDNVYALERASWRCRVAMTRSVG